MPTVVFKGKYRLERARRRSAWFDSGFTMRLRHAGDVIADEPHREPVG